MQNIDPASHLGLVHYVLHRLPRTLTRRLERDELLGAGTVALVEAAASFDPRRSVAFSSYAMPRIRGAMLDALRKDAGPRDLPTLVDLPSSIPSPDSRIEWESERVRLASAVGSLSAPEREVIEALFLRELPARTYAESAGLTEARVSQRKRSALRTLHRKLS